MQRFCDYVRKVDLDSRENRFLVVYPVILLKSATKAIFYVLFFYMSRFCWVDLKCSALNLYLIYVSFLFPGMWHQLKSYLDCSDGNLTWHSIILLWFQMIIRMFYLSYGVRLRCNWIFLRVDKQIKTIICLGMLNHAKYYEPNKAKPNGQKATKSPLKA